MLKILLLTNNFLLIILKVMKSEHFLEQFLELKFSEVFFFYL